MKNVPRSLQFAAQWITLGLAIAFVVGLLAPQSVERLRVALRPAAASGSEPAAPARAPNPVVSSYKVGVNRAAPAVVSIYANKMETRVEQGALVPNDPQLRDMIGAIPLTVRRSVPAQNLGSGVVFNADGYILTNFHVIKDAREISAVLQDGRVIAAKIIGSDEETDLAVLHIDAFNTQTVVVADQPPAVGDVVLAIGNPFGLGNTVTMGIVSAIGRQVSATSSEDFLQTDAPINTGNSGGALVNTAGELVGINSNNYSPSAGGGSVGIGFAIPVNTAKSVLEQIIRHGRVIRGWLGATYQDIAPQQNDPMPVVTNGATIMAVDPIGPASRAGIKAGDVVTRFDGKWVPNSFALRNREAHGSPGSKVMIAGLRDGKPFNFEIALAERPGKSAAAASR
ncbi:MAG: trypsin-like peptidase domain-containing protein [Rudaea sp.]